MIAMALLVGDKLYCKESPKNGTVRIGPDRSCDLVVREFREHILVTWKNGHAEVVTPSGHITVPQGNITVIDPGKRIALLFVPASRSPERVYLDGDRRIFVGRTAKTRDGRENDIIIDLPFISSAQMELICKDGRLSVRNDSQTNGTFVNGEKIAQRELQPGDVISILTFWMVYDGNSLSFFNAGSALTVKEARKAPVQATREKKVPPPVKNEGYPWFERREFVGVRLRKEPYVIEKLPEIGATPSVNWVQVLAGPAAMLMIACVMMAMGMSNMLMMLPMQLVGVVTALISYFTQKKKFSKTSSGREKAYTDYLSEAEAELERIAQDQRQALQQSNPAGASCMEIVRERKPGLWSRDAQSKDLLEISLGVGRSDLSCPVEVYRPGRFDSDVDPLTLKAVALADRYRQINGVPITFSLRQNNAVAVVGLRGPRTAMLQQMLISLSTLHTPEDLKIAIVYSEEEEREWSFFRFLPHVWDANRTSRLIAGSDADAEVLLAHFADLAETRQRAAEEYRSSVPTPFYILVITDPKFLNRITNAGRLLPQSPAKGMTTLIATGGSVPSGCRHIIEVQPDQSGVLQGTFYPTSDRNQVTDFRPSPIPREDAEAIVRAMAPIRLRSGKEGKGLPSFISLFKGRGIGSAKELRTAEAWRSFRASDSMAVSLGVGSDGKDVVFDIHEKRDGPMGLIAGTTRAGKTELIQTWIIQMASKFSPEEVNFVLFDFKGTSLIDPLKALPHLVGYISNTGPDDSGQDFELRYCAALNSEIIRRQNLLSRTESTNILEYQKKYRDRQVTEPMPFLMIILDEFARIKETHPDFIKLANSLYATGGSLGMYVILSTQDPASAISSEIRANSAFQLCARVADDQDSREMIGVPDAARLPKIPGRAFLRVRAQGTLRCFQSFYAGAAYDVRTQRSENAMPTALIAPNGNALTVAADKPDFSELDAAVEHIRQVAGALRIPEAHKVWLPPLEKQIGIYGILRTRPGEEPRQRNVPDSLTAVVGVTDDPARQAQYATELDFGQFGSAMVCGGPSSGKTTFLLTASVSLAHLYAPERIRMYLIDGGSGALMSMDTFPHTARTLSAHTQPGDCAKILTQLQNEVKTRQQKLAARGVQDMAAYRRLTGEEIPDTLLVIDDIGEVRKSLEAARSGSAVDSIVYLLKFGASSGIYLLLSACKQQELYKFADSIRPEMRFVLRMPDKTDAREILGLPSNPPVITAPGRGLSVGRTGEKRPLVFQTALPWTVADPAVRLPELRRLGQQMADRCGKVFGDRPVEIPEHIPFGSIPAPAKGLALGLALDGSGTVGSYSDPNTSVLTVVGSDAALRASAATMIARQASQSGRYEQGTAITPDTDATAALEKLRADVKANMQNGSGKKFFLMIRDLPEVYGSLPAEQRQLLDKFILHGGTRFGIDCLFTAAPKALAELPVDDSGVVPAGVTLFRRPMLYLDGHVASSDPRFRAGGQPDGAPGPEDADYVEGFDDERHAVRIRRMLDR